MKKTLPLILILCLLLGICSLFSGCVNTGRVIYLNPDPTAADAWANVAAAYRRETGISVSILTVYDGNYIDSMITYLASLTPPTLFHCNTAAEEEAFINFLANLNGFGLEEPLSDDRYCIRDQRDKLLAVGLQEGLRFAVYSKASRADTQATAAFLRWLMTSETGLAFLESQYGTDLAIG